ncbi:MAG TPA: inositol monophosphatase family protein [Candidatus Limnocylindrales bacterium]
MPITDPELALAAAEAGAVVVRSRYGGPLERFDKGAGDFATAADIEAEKAILEVLRAARPGDAVLGEETGLTGVEGTQRVWMVDPLCGTLNFAARTPLVAVNVALRDGGVVTAAASVDPLAGEAFWTDGAGALLRFGGVDEPLAASAATALVEINVDPPYGSEQALRLMADPRFGERFRPRVISTTLGLAWLAAGRRAAYLTAGDLRDNVHFAAGLALCEAAGCVITDLNGDPLHSGPASGLLASADSGTHQAILELLR